MRGRFSLLVAVSVAALTVAAVAAARPTHRTIGDSAAQSTKSEQRHYTAADQALARSVVLKVSDLGSASSWRGGISPAETSQPRSCPNFHPRQSDLVITGDVQSDFTQVTGSLQYHDEAQIMRNSKMVRLDWNRNVVNPAAISCLRTFFVQNLVADQHFVSLTRIPVPHFATYTAGYRALVDQNGVRNMIDVLFVGRDRTELTFETSAPYADHTKVEQSELRLAKRLIARAPASS